MKEHKSRIARRFGAAAERYDAASPLQREAAQRLAQRVLALPLPAQPRVLEIGCGTGHLTRALLPYIAGEWLVSDIAAAMVGACRRQFGDGVRCIVMDGERPACAPGNFDLIVSNLTAQWFTDLPAALAELASLLAPGGHIALSTLGAGTFAEWRDAHAVLGLRIPTLDYPDAGQLARTFPVTLRVDVAAEQIVEPIDSPLGFVRGLRAIGADTPRPGAIPLAAGQLRRVLHTLGDAAPNGMTYHLLYAVATRPAPAVTESAESRP